jgi:hypothetical protein
MPATVLLPAPGGPATTQAGAALAAALIVIYRAPEVHGAVRALSHARFSLA